MKILICTGSFITGSGGVASYAHDFIDAFPEHQFVVVTHDNYKRTNESYEVIHHNMEDWSVNNAKQLLKIIQRESPDLVVNSYYKLLALVTPYLPENIKIISVSHFTDGGYAWAAGMNGNYADSIVALSTYAKEYIDKKFNIKDKQKTQVIYNYMPAIDDVDLSAKKKSNILKIVYPGGHSWQKSAEIVAHAIQKVCKTDLEFELYWLGNIDLPGANWPLSKTKTIRDCLPMGDSRIKHVGRVEREESKRIMSEANIFLLPSRGEGCPITLLEAMRGGCIPVISDAKHGSLDIIEHGKTGFIVKQDSVDDLVSCIMNVISNHKDYTFIYDNTITKFKNDIEYHVWKENMSALMAVHSSHQTRLTFCKFHYYRHVLYMKSLYLFNWARDRFVRQLYHVIYFRALKYMKKI